MCVPINFVSDPPRAGASAPDEIEALFDAVSYQKGAAVLRMLRAYLLRDASAQPQLRRSLLQVRFLRVILC